MKIITITITLAAVSVLVSNLAWAEDTKPDNDISVNLSVVTDYRYRGISQTRLQPALQGGADFTNNPSGFYAGTWLSTIKWIKDISGGGNSAIEWDLYVGRRGALTEGISYDVGGLYYKYPNNGLGGVGGFGNADTIEIYGQLGVGPVYIKYAQSTTNLFGNPGSKSSGYLDVGTNLELGNNFLLNLHAGYQKVKGPNSSVGSYSDYKIGVTREFKNWAGITMSIAAIGTDADRSFYASPANGKNLGKNSVVFSLSKVF